MVNVVGVALTAARGVAFFTTKETLKKGTCVIIETDNGIDYGIVKVETYMEKEENLPLPLKKVVHIATESDLKQIQENSTISEKALELAKKLSKELGLEMTFIDAFFTFDKNQLVFSFLSDARVDFRELAKKLAQKYKTRIELRQIGVRDKAKKVGGLGPCGLFLCCHTFLTDFNSVSINMAKNQYLALNPSKINGICGRLLCCLGYEDKTYTDLKQGLPKVGVLAETTAGIGKVVSVDVFQGTFQVDLKDKGIIKLNKENYNGNVK